MLCRRAWGVACARTPCLGWLTGKLGRCAAVPNHARDQGQENGCFFFSFFNLSFLFDDGVRTVATSNERREKAKAKLGRKLQWSDRSNKAYNPQMQHDLPKLELAFRARPAEPPGWLPVYILVLVYSNETRISRGGFPGWLVE